MLEGSLSQSTSGLISVAVLKVCFHNFPGNRETDIFYLLIFNSYPVRLPLTSRKVPSMGNVLQSI